MPGVFGLAFILAMIFSQVIPGRHWSRGFRVTTVSNIERGAVSECVSACPVLPNTVATSGIPLRSRSQTWRMRVASAMDLARHRRRPAWWGSLPSLSGGMNSFPSRR